MNKTTKTILGLIVAVLAVWGIYSISQKPSEPTVNEPIKIGVILPLSGDLASVSEDVKKGIDLFKKNYNDVEFIIENDEGENKKSVNAFKKLVDFDNINYIVGPLGPIASEAVYGSQSDNNKKEVTIIGLSMCADSFKEYDNMMCNYPSPYYQLLESYKYPVSIGKNKFYIIRANDAFAESIQNMVQQVSNEIGLELLGSETVDSKELNFSIAALKAINSNPEFITILVVDQSANIGVIKSLKEMGYKGMIMTGGDFEEDTVKNFQDVFEGVYISGQADLVYSSDFLTAFRAQENSEPNLYSAFGYVWADILYNIIKLNPGHQVDISELMNYVNSNSDSFAIKGMKFNSDNKEIFFPMKVLRVEGGEMKTVFVSGSN